VSEIKAPEYLSPSSISTFRQCPLKFKYNKIDKLPDPSNHWAVLGNFVHDVLEEMYKLAPELRTIDACKVIARQIWNEEWKEKAESTITHGDSLVKFMERAWSCIENLWKIENPVDTHPEGLEYELNGFVGGVRMKGFIDRYSYSEGTTMLVVSDYKTGKTPKYDVEEKFKQLLIYAELLQSLEVGSVDKIELLYLKDGVKLEKKVSVDNLKQTVEMIQQAKSDIDDACRTGVFPPIKSGLCMFCSYKKICPIWNKGVK